MYIYSKIKIAKSNNSNENKCINITWIYAKNCHIKTCPIPVILNQPRLLIFLFCVCS